MAAGIYEICQFGAGPQADVIGKQILIIAIFTEENGRKPHSLFLGSVQRKIKLTDLIRMRKEKR